jgi:hypothetical protein
MHDYGGNWTAGARARTTTPRAKPFGMLARYTGGADRSTQLPVPSHEGFGMLARYAGDAASRVSTGKY